VHCWGGKGRTGTVVGCWLVRHGKATGDQALAMIQELRKNDPTRYEPSPENETQRQMVREWKPGE
jgi:protein-tyrosine phosphatase